MKLVQFAASRVVRGALRLSFKWPSRLPVSLQALRKGVEASAVLFRPRKDAQVQALTLGGCDAVLVQPVQGEARHVILHLHGGAFFAGSIETHLALAAEMAVRAQAQVYLLDYRLAPEHTHPAPIDDALAAYSELVAQGVALHELTVSGDSAGAGMAVNLALRLRDQGLPMPARLVLMSPFVDLTLSSDTIASKAFADPMLDVQTLQRGVQAYCGELLPSDPAVSPVFADLTGLPPILIQVGSDEILLNDSRLLAKRAQQAGVQVQLSEYPGMWHNFQIFSLMVAKAEYALAEISDFIH